MQGRASTLRGMGVLPILIFTFCMKSSEIFLKVATPNAMKRIFGLRKKEVGFMRCVARLFFFNIIILCDPKQPTRRAKILLVWQLCPPSLLFCQRYFEW